MRYLFLFGLMLLTGPLMAAEEDIYNVVGSITINLPKKSFYFVRHGQTDDNLQSICSSQRNVPLNATGQAQIEKARLFLPTSIATICHSPLRRAQQTAEILNQELKKPMVVIHNLIEISMGVWEGQNEDLLASYNLPKNYAPQGGEAREFFEFRVIEGVRQALTFPGPVLIVAHNDVFEALAKMFGYTYNGVANGVIVKFTPPTDTDPKWRIEFLQ